jgi:hypothetical protein
MSFPRWTAEALVFQEILWVPLLNGKIPRQVPAEEERASFSASLFPILQPSK